MARAKDNPSKRSELSEWLIDSGCSNHMTPFEDDLITDIGSSKSLVEVANGNIVKAPKKGTAFIRIVDVKTHKTFDILLEDVLYVPGLSRRLFSVTQWTNSGGSLSFHGTTCKIAYQDAKNPATQFSMNLYAPFSPNDTAHHLVRPTAAFAKVDIPSDLLHRRLGHRSIQALGLASKSNLWADASLIPSEDTFCWGCEITFSKKANRGKSDLIHDTDLCPGSCLMLDLQQNTSCYGLN